MPLYLLLIRCSLVCTWTFRTPEWLWSQEGSSWLFLFLVLLNIGLFCYFSYIMELQPSLNCFLQALHHFWQVCKHGDLHSCYQTQAVSSGRTLGLLVLMSLFLARHPRHWNRGWRPAAPGMTSLLSKWGVKWLAPSGLALPKIEPSFY